MGRWTRRGCAAGVLLLTAVVAGAAGRAGPAPVPAGSGHDHSSGVDPVTSAVLLVNVIVLAVLAVLARRRPPGVRRPGPAWCYRERAESSGDRDVSQPDGPRVHSPAGWPANRSPSN